MFLFRLRCIGKTRKKLNAIDGGEGRVASARNLLIGQSINEVSFLPLYRYLFGIPSLDCPLRTCFVLIVALYAL